MGTMKRRPSERREPWRVSPFRGRNWGLGSYLNWLSLRWPTSKARNRVPLSLTHPVLSPVCTTVPFECIQISSQMTVSQRPWVLLAEYLCASSSILLLSLPGIHIFSTEITPMTSNWLSGHVLAIKHIFHKKRKIGYMKRLKVETGCVLSGTR